MVPARVESYSWMEWSTLSEITIHGYTATIWWDCFLIGQRGILRNISQTHFHCYTREILSWNPLKRILGGFNHRGVHFETINMTWHMGLHVHQALLQARLAADTARAVLRQSRGCFFNSLAVDGGYWHHGTWNLMLLVYGQSKKKKGVGRILQGIFFWTPDFNPPGN